ncbi:low temperature requirement protein A [Microcoleus sp. PH2017_30_WIL_O_A]|jgi:low temperature requirement protein LtrA|uniref:low temperature requirement protein A n=1 Tax=Microcoleus sp. PH2017_30_WIL_O_A TaxID=2798840 RepID=UPI001E065ABA|nr:low temperature requirement protein A [Microcoleus sp. PH2017_30_WIL_O_A]MCC3587346.1 low temperature requirement protein A [Microcoleus sp. PH2017_30_WIL_O_A]
MAKRIWWQKPQIRTDEEQQLHRKVSWLELFFDLVFVVIIAELSHNLAIDVSWVGAGKYILLFLPAWWVWIGATYYNERFETEGIENRLFTFLLILAVAGLAVFSHHGLGETSVGFALSYVFARSIVTVLWWRAGYHEPSFRPTAKRFVIGSSISIAFFILSVFVPPPTRFILWVIGLFVDINTPIFTLRHQSKLPQFSSSRLPERYGLFMIIVLGEAVVSVVQGLAAKEHFDFAHAITGILGMTLIFGIWWIYFDFVARRPPKPATGWVFAWGYLHMPLVMSVTATAAGINNVIASKATVLPLNVRCLICGSLAISLAVIALLETTLRRDEDEPAHPIWSPALKLAAAVVTLIVGLFGGLGAIALLSLLVILLAIQMSYGLWVWFR